MKATAKRTVIVASMGALLLFSTPLPWAQTQRSAQGSAKGMRASANSQLAAKLQPLNIKPGLWETPLTIKRTGAVPIPAEMLNRLTPEQRARVEERMKANSAAHTHTVKRCITKEDLERETWMGKMANAKDCTVTVLNSSSTRFNGKMVCDIEGMHVIGNLELVAGDPEHVDGSYHSTTTGDGHTMNVESTWTSKWLGPGCGNVR
jgi:hypothetical protein